MTTEAAQPSRQEAIAAAFEQVESGNAAQDAPAIVTETPEKAAPEAEAKPGRTAGRERDDQGRLLPGKPKKAEGGDEVKEAKAPEAAPAAVVVQKPERKPIRIGTKDVDWWKRPSSWSPDTETDWEAASDKLKQFAHKREFDMINGVSTYKAEYDRVKPIDEVLKPYMPYLEQAGIRPEDAIGNLMGNHRTFTHGTPEQKLQLFARLSQEYQIPLHQLLVQGEDGKVYLNQQYFQQQQQQAASGITPQDIDRIVNQRMAMAQMQAAAQQFKAAKDKDGNPLYPYVEQVGQTMTGLLRAGLAKDLPSAYEAALRMPQHAELYAQLENSKREAEAKAAIAAKTEQAAQARAAAVSPKSQPTTGTVTKANKGSKSRLEALSEAFEQHAGASGRV